MVNGFGRVRVVTGKPLKGYCSSPGKRGQWPRALAIEMDRWIDWKEIKLIRLDAPLVEKHESMIVSYRQYHPTMCNTGG